MPHKLFDGALSWLPAEDIETKALQQIKNLSELPIIYKHVGIMPDAHYGMGAVVGSVIPTTGAIIPAAVGVDIGCFVGDTRVPLLDGTEQTLKALAERGGSFWIYSVDRNTMHVVPGNAKSIKTRVDAPLVKITVSDGQKQHEVTCTPDHEFMLRDGSYRQACDLDQGTSLIPLNRSWQAKNHHEIHSNGQGRAWLTNRMVYERVYGSIPDDHVVDHDNSPLDNRPENLVLKRSSDSSVLHGRRTRATHDYHRYNRTVVTVEHLSRREDVYCLQVEDHNNFALSAGVFVHNCGMIAKRTSLTRSTFPKDLTDLRESIERRVPLEAGARNRLLQPSVEQRWAGLQAGIQTPSMYAMPPRMMMEDESLYITARQQLGSLGSGNHFIELVTDSDDWVWAFLHSGSRGIGNKIAQHHIKIAKQQAKESGIDMTLPDPDLSWLTEGTDEFNTYWNDMQWCQQYALENRREMMDRVLAAVAESVYGDHERELDIDMTIECHHNFSEKENHFDKDIYVSRKGAIQADTGRYGLIPGSMGTASYVVVGKGNPDSFNTAPHGAGRRFSRTKARKTFTMEDFDESMKGIEVRRTKEFLDEIPAAYKDIDMVMEAAEDLVTPLTVFSQFINVKGASGLRRRKGRRGR